MKPTDFIIPCVLAAVLLLGAVKRVNVFDTFVEGAREGIGTAVKILPALVALMTAVGMFRASGALELLTGALEPVLASIGIPPEVVPLAMLRPVTGSGAMALFDGILREHGAENGGEHEVWKSCSRAPPRPPFTRWQCTTAAWGLRGRGTRYPAP